MRYKYTADDLRRLEAAGGIILELKEKMNSQNDEYKTVKEMAQGISELVSAAEESLYGGVNPFDLHGGVEE